MPLLSVTIGKILEYYAILCLAFMPVNVVLMIILSRRTSLLTRIDAFIDRILPPEPKKENKEEPKKDTAPSEEKKETAPAVPTEEEIRRMSGISSFEILVGETYRCHLNFQNRGGSYGEMVWYNDNEFVGDISESGVFKGKKVGRSNIFCAGKGGMYGSETQAYCINVVSRLGRWFADTLIEDVAAQTPRVDIIARSTKRRILRENPKSRLLEYDGLTSEKSRSLTYQFSESGTLQRAFYRLQATPAVLDETLAMLAERFEEIKLNVSDGYRVWIHQIIDNDHEEVDIYAVLRQNPDDELILAFGQSWRDYGEKEEFTDNIRMAIRLFAMVFDTDRLQIEAKKEKPEGQSDRDDDKNGPEPKENSPSQESDNTDKDDTLNEDGTESPEGDAGENGTDTNPDAAATLAEFDNFSENNDSQL